MANIKLAKYVRDQGFCCLWAWLEAKRAELTSALMPPLEHFLTRRALQWNRARYRKKLIQCECLEPCLKKRIRDGHKIP